MPIKILPLTAIKIAKARPAEKPYYLRDGEGLRLLVRPTGTKTWQYEYKFNGTPKIHTLGDLDMIDLAEARERRTEARKLLKAGIDPHTAKTTEKLRVMEEGANTFEKIAREWLGKQDFAPKHGKNVLSRMEKDVFKAIGHMPINDIQTKDIVSILHAIEARDAPNVAQRINQYCISVFDYAILSARCVGNPAQTCRKLVKLPPIQNRPHLKEAELPDFLQSLQDAKQGKMTLAVRLLALTFLRPGELRTALWTDVDDEKKQICIPAERMKENREHIVPLSNQAFATLTQLQELTGRSIYLLPGQKLTKPVSDVALIKAVTKLTKGKARPHGFRHTASTILNEKDYNRDHIEMQLAHIEGNKVRGTYNKAKYLEQRTVMMQQWADYLDEQLKKAQKGTPHETR